MPPARSQTDSGLTCFPVFLRGLSPDFVGEAHLHTGAAVRTHRQAKPPGGIATNVVIPVARFQNRAAGFVTITTRRKRSICPRPGHPAYCDPWSAEAAPAREIAAAVLPGCEHVMEYHMIAKGRGWAAVEGQPPVRLGAGDVVIFPQGDPHVMSSAPGIEPLRQTADWVFSTRNDPKPIPIAYHHGVVDAGASLPVEEADTIAVCGFLGCDLKPFNPLVAVLPRILHLAAGHAGD